MGRPKQDGSHDLERAQTQIVFGRLRSQNPHMTLIELEESLDIGSKDGNTISRYLNGHRSKSLDELAGLIKKARKKKLLASRSALSHRGDDLLDPRNQSASTIKPSEVIARVNKKIHAYQKLVLNTKKVISDLQAHMHEMRNEGFEFYTDLTPNYPVGYPEDKKDTVEQPFDIDKDLKFSLPDFWIPPSM